MSEESRNLLTLGPITALILALCVWGPGCEQKASPPKADTVQVGQYSVPPDTGVYFQETVNEGSESTTDSGTATGPGLATSAAEQAGSFNPESPNLVFSKDGTSGNGGGAAFNFDLKGFKFNEMGLVGAFLALGALFAAYRKRFQLALLLGVGAGLAFFASAIPAWILGLAIIGGVVLYWKREASHEALRGILEGVENLPDDVRSTVKKAVSKTTDANDKATITAVKKSDELPTER